MGRIRRWWPIRGFTVCCTQNGTKGQAVVTILNASPQGNFQYTFFYKKHVHEKHETDIRQRETFTKHKQADLHKQ